MNKLLSLLDCYDLSDVAYDFLQNSPKYIDNSELDFQIKEILKKGLRVIIGIITLLILKKYI